MTMEWARRLTLARSLRLFFQHGTWKLKDVFFFRNVLQLQQCTSCRTMSFIKSSYRGSLLCYTIPKCRRTHLIEASSLHFVCFSTKTEVAEKRIKSKQKKKSRSSNHESIIKTDSGSTDISLDELQAKFKERKNHCSHVFKQSVAEKIVTTIMKHRTNPSAPVLDLRAGPGLVSREFLRQGASKVVALELGKEFCPLLSTLQNKIGSDRFQFFHWQMDNLYLKLHGPANTESTQAFQKMESEVAESLMTPQSNCDPSGVPYSLVSIGGRGNNEYFMFYILRNLPNEDPILSRGRVELFFLAHSRLKYKIDYIATFQRSGPGMPIASRDKSQATRFSYLHALIHLLYDIDVLGEFDVDDFCPSFNSIKAKQDRDIDPSKRLLMRMQLKPNIDEILPLQHHTPFLNFLFQVYKKKTVRTIPAMEMLIPGCGLRMLAEGFTMMDIIIMSHPENFLRLYKMMLEWPEYRSSPLHNFLVMKMTGSVDDDSFSDGDGHQ